MSCVFIIITFISRNATVKEKVFVSVIIFQVLVLVVFLFLVVVQVVVNVGCSVWMRRKCCGMFPAHRGVEDVVEVHL